MRRSARHRFWIVVTSLSLLVACGKSDTSSTIEREMAPIAEAKSEAQVTVETRSEPDLFKPKSEVYRRTCPSTKCGAVGVLFYPQEAEIFELRDGWVRITEPYDGKCKEGVSSLIDVGNQKCEPENGIIDGQIVEWADATEGIDVRPPKFVPIQAPIQDLVAKSDDFSQYGDAFVAAAKSLIADGKCTEGDFREAGGWIKSTTTYAREPVYFTYCGGWTVENRIYLNAKSGRIFR